MLPPEARLDERLHGDAPRPLRRGLAAALALALLAGCGDDGGEEPTGEGATALRISLDADGPGGKRARSRAVSCEGGTSTVACEALESLSPFAIAEPDPDAACTEIYGGPDVATVSGTLEGEPLQVRLTRADGCEISRFDAWAPVLRALFPGYRPGSALAP